MSGNIIEGNNVKFSNRRGSDTQPSGKSWATKNVIELREAQVQVHSRE